MTARGNRREPIFFEDGDQDIYCDILAEQMRKARVEVWSYCLMPEQGPRLLQGGYRGNIAPVPVFPKPQEALLPRLLASVKQVFS